MFNLGRISKTVKIDKNPLLNPMIFEIWDLKNTISRAETFEKGDFSKNDYSRAENNSNQVFFKKKLGSKNQVSNLILPWESNKSDDFFIQYFQNSHFKMWIWHSKISNRTFTFYNGANHKSWKLRASCRAALLMCCMPCLCLVVVPRGVPRASWRRAVPRAIVPLPSYNHMFICVSPLFKAL